MDHSDMPHSATGLGGGYQIPRFIGVGAGRCPSTSAASADLTGSAPPGPLLPIVAAGLQHYFW